MSKKDKDYLISAAVLLIVGWFFAGIICYSVALVLINKIEEKSTLVTVLKVISVVGITLTGLTILRLI